VSFTRSDPTGWLIFLDSNERKDLGPKLVAGAATVTPVLVAMGMPIVAAGIIGAALSAHASWELALMGQADKGDGVVLWAPTPLWIGMIVVPKTRYPDVIGAWSEAVDAEITTWDRDIIKTHLDHGAVGTDNVEFVMRNHSSSGWPKGFILRDGEGSEWTEIATPGKDAGNGLWAQQVRNGQVLTLIKAKTWGWMTPIISLGDMEKLQSGDRVTFTWTQDS
jgi:hypothetical protein